MRSLIRLMFLLALTAVAVSLLRDLKRDWIAGRGFQNQYQRTRDAVSSLTYRLDEGHDLGFAVPPATTSMRLVVNGVVGRKHADPDKEFAFELGYRWRDGEGKVLHSGTYHFLSRISRDPAGVAERPPQFFEDRRWQPTDGRASIFHVGDWDELPETLSFSLTSRDAEIDYLVLRCYALEQLPEDEAGQAWNRIPRRQRRELARDNIYPASRLNDAERAGLMRTRWRPLGPTGIMGRDYATQALYTEDRANPVRSSHPQAALGNGLDLAPQHAATYVLEKTENALQLELVTAPDSGPVTVEVSQSGQGLPVFRRFVLGGGRHELGDWSAGLLTLRVDRPAHLALWRDDTLVNLSGFTTPSYLSGPDRVLEYGFHSEAGAGLRLDLRAPAPADSITWQYSFLDERGQVLADGQSPYLREPSPYLIAESDRPEFDRLSDTARWFFRLPAGARHLRLASSAPLLVSAYVRPANWVFREVEEQGADQWFSLRPEIGRDEKVLIRVLDRPSEVDEVERPWRAEPLLPRGDWLGHYVWLSRPEEPFQESDPLSTVYTRTRVNRTQKVRFRANPGEDPLIRPALVYFKDGKAPVTLKVSLDDEVLFSQTVSATHGDIGLPPLKQGVYRWLISCDDPSLQVFVNYRRPGGVYRRKRMAARLGREPLRYLVTKHHGGAMSLKGWYLGRESGDAPVELRMRLEGVSGGTGPSEEFTFTVRDEVLVGETGQIAEALVGNGQVLAEHQPFYFPIKADVSPGTYRLVVENRSGQDGYLLLSKIWQTEEATIAHGTHQP